MQTKVYSYVGIGCLVGAGVTGIVMHSRRWKMLNHQRNHIDELQRRLVCLNEELDNKEGQIHKLQSELTSLKHDLHDGVRLVNGLTVDQCKCADTMTAEELELARARNYERFGTMELN